MIHFFCQKCNDSKTLCGKEINEITHPAERVACIVCKELAKKGQHSCGD